MRGAWKLTLLLAVAALAAAALVACGGGDSGDSTAASTATTTQESTTESGSADDGSGDSSADEGSASFRTPGGDNSIQEFGEEADAADLDEASAALGGFLEARAGDDWAKQCALLAKSTVAPLEQLAKRSSQL